MSIESKVPRQEINISYLSLETPEAEKLPFDANVEITEQDWKEMRKSLWHYRQERLWHDYSMLAMYMKILQPKVSEGFAGGMSDELIKMRRNKQWGDFIFQAAALKVTHPDVTGAITTEGWENIKLYLDSLRNENKWHLFSSVAAFAKIFEPSRDSGLTGEDWKWMKDVLDTARQAKDWAVFSSMASTMKILDPNCDLNLTGLEWAGMKKELQEDRQASVKWKRFAPHAMSMKILAAPKIAVTAPGVLKFYKQSETQPTSLTTPLPEIKKF